MHQVTSLRRCHRDCQQQHVLRGVWWVLIICHSRFKNTPRNHELFNESKDSDRAMQQIFAMAVGMDEAAELSNFDEEPFKSSKVKNQNTRLLIQSYLIRSVAMHCYRVLQFLAMVKKGRNQKMAS